jgi:hypothetical protein
LGLADFYYDPDTETRYWKASPAMPVARITIESCGQSHNFSKYD